MPAILLFDSTVVYIFCCSNLLTPVKHKKKKITLTLLGTLIIADVVQKVTSPNNM